MDRRMNENATDETPRAVAVAVTESDYRKLERLAQAQQMRVSDYLHELIEVLHDPTEPACRELIAA